MKLGATDFVRKPMTPETLRNAVAAALSKSPPQLSISTPQPGPLIQTIAMNGFTIMDDEKAPPLEENHRRFIVVSPDGQRHDVLVEIDLEAIEYIKRMTTRWLAADNSFWTVQAQELLSDFLWNHGTVPPLRRLTLQEPRPGQSSGCGALENWRGGFSWTTIWKVNLEVNETKPWRQRSSGYWLEEH